MLVDTKPTTKRASACSRYQSLELTSRLDGADAHSLVSILYEELQRAIDIAALAVRQSKLQASNKQIERARSILIALQASLDFKLGGSLAVVLATVYRAMHKELSNLSAHNSHTKLDGLSEGIREISTAWASLRR